VNVSVVSWTRHFMCKCSVACMQLILLHTGSRRGVIVVYQCVSCSTAACWSHALPLHFIVHVLFYIHANCSLPYAPRIRASTRTM